MENTETALLLVPDAILTFSLQGVSWRMGGWGMGGGGRGGEREKERECQADRGKQK